jgi:hypothetical protein
LNDITNREIIKIIEHEFPVLNYTSFNQSMIYFTSEISFQVIEDESNLSITSHYGSHFKMVAKVRSISKNIMHFLETDPYYRLLINTGVIKIRYYENGSEFNLIKK